MLVVYWSTLCTGAEQEAEQEVKFAHVRMSPHPAGSGWSWFLLCRTCAAGEEKTDPLLICKHTHCLDADKEMSPWRCACKHWNTLAEQEVLFYMENRLLDLWSPISPPRILVKWWNVESEMVRRDDVKQNKRSLSQHDTETIIIPGIYHNRN